MTSEVVEDGAIWGDDYEKSLEDRLAAQQLRSFDFLFYRDLRRSKFFTVNSQFETYFLIVILELGNNTFTTNTINQQTK